MNFETTDLFDKQAKKLSKRYRGLGKDLITLMDNFEQLHYQSTSIQKNIYKIRLANSDKNRGKSAGYRIYYYIMLKNTTYLLTIYDKSDTEMIDESLLTDIVLDLERDKIDFEQNEK